jgi:hypothetical protein
MAMLGLIIGTKLSKRIDGAKLNPSYYLAADGSSISPKYL